MVWVEKDIYVFYVSRTHTYTRTGGMGRAGGPGLSPPRGAGSHDDLVYGEEESTRGGWTVS